MLRKIVICILAISGLAGCATAPRPGPPNPQVEAKLMDANASLDQLNEEVKKFQVDIEELNRHIASLNKEEGWADMQNIIRSIPSLPESDDPMKEMGKAPETAEWSRKWGRPWEPLFTMYIALMEHSTALDVRRTALKSEITSTQAKYLAISVAELSAYRYAPGKSAYDTMEMLGKWVDDLDSYTINPAVGLYEATPK